MINKIKKQQGFSTIDALVALALLAIVFGPIISLTLGEQTLAVDSETNHAAILLAKQNVETAIAQIRSDFNASVAPTGTDHFYDDYDLGGITAPYISPCSRSLNSLVAWKVESREQSSEISSIITWPEEARRMGLCDPLPPTGDWDTPIFFNSLSPSDFSGEGTGIAVSTIDNRRYAFLTTDSASQNNFYAIDTTNFDPDDPSSISVDDIHGVKIGNKGLNGVVVVGGYAYVLYDNTAEQLKVIDVHNPASIDTGAVVSRTLPMITNGLPRSIFYYDDKIYIGTQYVPCGVGCTDPNQNNEFHVFNVSSPMDPQPGGSIDVDRNVNAISVINGLAYLATGSGSSSPYTPLKIFDIVSENEVGSFEISIQRDGTALYILEERLYLGLERTSTGNDFYILDISNPNPQELKSISLEENNTAVEAILVQGKYAFIGLDGGNEQNNFQVWGINDLDNLWRLNPKKCNGGFPQGVNGLVFKDNLIFSSNRSQLDLKIIYDDPDEICEE